MHSPCIREASEACFHGCCPSPFLDPRTPNSSVTTESSSSSRHDFASAIASTLYPNTQFSNHESLPSLEDSISSFIKAYPQYKQSNQADRIRAEEYYHLSLSKHVCLDYIGHGLFSYSQQKALSLQCSVASSSSSTPFQSVKSTDLQPPFFDISHKSTTLKSQISYGSQESELESKIRTRIMGFMNLSEADYHMVFTANQSSAFKLLADSYPFRTNRNLLTVYDHQSDAVDVMIESSRKRGARVMSAEFLWPNLRIESRKLMKMIIGKGKKENKGLFVFPLQSRMTGARYAYRWMSLAREHGWDVLLDTCALGPKEMETLGLSIFGPDVLFCSCFKIFGENPSGFGCLFVKRSSVSVFNDSAMASGFGIVSLVPVTGSQWDETTTISPSSPKSLWQMLRDDGYASQENEEDIKGKRALSESKPAMRFGIECRGLDQADSLGLILISCRARYLINWLVNALMSLKHPDSGQGCSLVTIYGPKINFERGPAVAFNLFDWKGEKVDPPLVQKLADRNNISLSYGSLRHMLFSDKYEERDRVLETRTCEVEGTYVKRKKKLPSEVFVVTAALGFLTNFEDVYRLWAFVSRFLDADFVEKERWRYTALNQKTVEV